MQWKTPAPSTNTGVDFLLCFLTNALRPNTAWKLKAKGSYSVLIWCVNWLQRFPNVKREWNTEGTSVAALLILCESKNFSHAERKQNLSESKRTTSQRAQICGGQTNVSWHLLQGCLPLIPCMSTTMAWNSTSTEQTSGRTSRWWDLCRTWGKFCPTFRKIPSKC